MHGHISTMVDMTRESLKIGEESWILFLPWISERSTRDGVTICEPMHENSSHVSPTLFSHSLAKPPLVCAQVLLHIWDRMESRQPPDHSIRGLSYVMSCSDEKKGPALFRLALVGRITPS